MLAGLLRDGNSAAARTLRAIGADPAAVREQVLRGGGAGPGSKLSPGRAG